MRPLFRRLTPYRVCLIMAGALAAFGLIASPLNELAPGLWRILMARGLLITDFIALGGLGAASMNAAISASASVMLLILIRAKPNGALIMCVWLVAGFSFFGKTVFNSAPIIFGVWLYAKLRKEPFSNFGLIALLSSTLGPLVGEVAHLGQLESWGHILAALAAGVAVGFAMPIVSAATTRVHGGYNLYNAGFAGGILAMFFMAISRYLGLDYERPLHWSEGQDLPLAMLLYALGAGLTVLGLLSRPQDGLKAQYKRVLGHSGRLVTDYYLLYGECIYLNMGLLTFMSVTLTLLIGAPLNGGTLAGIFTIIGFGSFGKHPRNCLPVMLGAILLSALSSQGLTAPGNVLAILLCTGLAPISGQYGWGWGMTAGFVHAMVVSHIGQSAGGMNLYNNGFVAGFVALVLVPVILTLKKGKRTYEDEI